MSNGQSGNIHKYFEYYYKGEKFISVMPFGTEADYNGFLAGNGCSGWDGMEIYVTGNEDRILVSARFDNLGKGASGAAIQCLNVMLGCDEEKGLNLQEKPNQEGARVLLHWFGFLFK